MWPLRGLCATPLKELHAALYSSPVGKLFTDALKELHPATNGEAVCSSCSLWRATCCPSRGLHATFWRPVCSPCRAVYSPHKTSWGTACSPLESSMQLLKANAHSLSKVQPLWDLHAAVSLGCSLCSSTGGSVQPSRKWMQSLRCSPPGELCRTPTGPSRGYTQPFSIQPLWGTVDSSYCLLGCCASLKDLYSTVQSPQPLYDTFPLQMQDPKVDAHSNLKSDVQLTSRVAHTPLGVACSTSRRAQYRNHTWHCLHAYIFYP